MRQPAEMGDPDAQNVLASLYERGWGVPQDVARAAALYLRSARQGHVASEAMIAGLYRSGYGVKQDLGLARRWYLLCARAGDANCVRALRELQPRSSAPAPAPPVAEAASPAPAPAAPVSAPAAGRTAPAPASTGGRLARGMLLGLLAALLVVLARAF